MDPQMKKELDEVLVSLGTPAAAEPDPAPVSSLLAPDPEPEPAPEPEPSPEPEPGPEPEPEPGPEPAEPAEPEPEPQEDELARIRKTLDEVLASKEAGRISLPWSKPAEPTQPEPGPVVQPQAAPQPTPVQSQVTPLQDVDFLEGLELEEVRESSEGLNKLLNKVYKAGIEAARAGIPEVTQQALSSVPELVRTTVKQQIAMQRLVDDFYVGNPDIAPFKNVVASAAASVAQEHSDWDAGKIMEEAAKLSREFLQLKAGAIAGDSPSQPESRPNPLNPSLPSPTTSRQPKGPTLTGLAKEMDDLLKLQ